MTMSAERTRRRAGDAVVRRLSRSASCAGECAAEIAGSMPTATPVTIEATNANSTTTTLGPASVSRGRFVGASATSALIDPNVTARPTAPPAAASNRLSTNIC